MSTARRPYKTLAQMSAEQRNLKAHERRLNDHGIALACHDGRIEMLEKDNVGIVMDLHRRVTKLERLLQEKMGYQPD